MLIASGETIALTMKAGVTETAFYRWLETKDKTFFESTSSSGYRFFQTRLTSCEIQADDTVDEDSVVPSYYANTMGKVVENYRNAYFDELYLAPLRKNETEKQHYIAMTLLPQLDIVTQKSKDDITVLVIQHLLDTRMKADLSGGEFEVDLDESKLGSINMLSIGSNLPQPHNLVNVVTVDMIMQTDTEIDNIEEMLLFIGMLFNGVRQDLLDVKTKLQAMATRILQGIWGVKDSIHELVHTRIKAEIDSLVHNGKLDANAVQEELRIINDINEIYKKIDTLTDLNNADQMYWKKFYLRVALPVLRYDFRKIALTSNEVLLEAYYKATGWSGTDAELQKVIDRQLEANIRRK